ncbi:serine/threonine-protein kinase [Nocardia acidivorans]|uniref:serine/threonine-protein kinase n=1 Tax=Nocardia acidivorans TaxID=404580 RepID=UPI000B086DC3|nr:serine/threonine-protein kinase [Nocardia acidivorans]
MTIRPLAQEDPLQIGRYRILGVLGSGGMGRVLLGAGADGRLVAIKQIHAHLLGEVEYRSRFRREVTASTRVSGAFTAPVIDFDVDSATPWLASVFVVGVPLDKVVQEYGPLPPQAVRMLAAGLASALEAIHRADLIHRDLKPANVLLASDGPRVIDFGIATATENPGGLTEAGAVLGSPAYMSPEQALSEPLTPASDVFSLGSLLVIAATGTSPFAASTMAYTLFNIVHTEPDLARVPPELRELIGPCLSKDPAARPTPTQILDYLGQPSGHRRPWSEPIHLEIDRLAIELAGLAADPEATTVLSGGRRGVRVAQQRTMLLDNRPPRSRSSRMLLLLLAVLLVVAGTAGAAWVRWGRGDDRQAASPQYTIAQMREADACAWLRSALGDSIPAGLAPSWPTNVSNWTLTASWVWGCDANGGAKQTLSFEPGAYVSGFVRTGATAAGWPILGSQDASTCERALQPTGAEQKWGLIVKVRSPSQCALADYVLTRLSSVTDLPRTADADQSLARVDPCALVDRTPLDSQVGPLPVGPTEDSAHTCVWEGTSEVAVNLRLVVPKPSADPQIDLGEGRRLLAPKSTVAAICTRLYSYRDVAKQIEQVEIQVHGNDDNEAHCAAAESIARSVVDKLPK